MYIHLFIVSQIWKKQYLFQETLRKNNCTQGGTKLPVPLTAGKPLPIKINATVMAADLHNVMVTHAVPFSEQKMLFFKINLKSTH